MPLESSVCEREVPVDALIKHMDQLGQIFPLLKDCLHTEIAGQDGYRSILEAVVLVNMIAMAMSKEFPQVDVERTIAVMNRTHEEAQH